MTTGDRVMTQHGAGVIKAWYDKGERRRMVVTLLDGGSEPERSYDPAELEAA